MLTILADMLLTASGQMHHHARHRKPGDSRDHWAGRFNTTAHHDQTMPPYRFNRFRDLW